jgi:hypothetical protein
MSSYGFAVGSSGYDDEDRLVNWQRPDTNLDQSWNLSAVGISKHNYLQTGFDIIPTYLNASTKINY